MLLLGHFVRHIPSESHDVLKVYCYDKEKSMNKLYVQDSFTERPFYCVRTAPYPIIVIIEFH